MTNFSQMNLVHLNLKTFSICWVEKYFSKVSNTIRITVVDRCLRMIALMIKRMEDHLGTLGHIQFLIPVAKYVPGKNIFSSMNNEKVKCVTKFLKSYIIFQRVELICTITVVCVKKSTKPILFSKQEQFQPRLLTLKVLLLHFFS